MSLRENHGYSLLELLVALALTAVIAAMMAQATGQLHPLRQIQARYDAQAIADRLTEVISNDLKSAIALPLSGSDTRLPVIGSVSGIRFVAAVKTGFEEEGLREVSYALEPGAGGGKRLVRRIALRRFGAGNDREAVQTDELFDPVASVRLQYLARDDNGQTAWADSWSRPDEVPGAISIVLDISTAVSSRTVVLPR